MDVWLEFLLLGLSAALLPGPLQAYYLVRAPQLGLPKALLLAAVPIMSDAPIVIATLLFLAPLPDFAQTWLARVGGFFLMYIGYRVWQNAQKPEREATASVTTVRSLSEAVLINLLNPNPYIFWATVLGPKVLQTARTSSWGAGLGLIFLFYTVMVAGSAGLIFLIIKTSLRLHRWRPVIHRGVAVLMLFFGLRWLLG